MKKTEMNKILDMVMSHDKELTELGKTLFEEKMNGRNDYRLLKEIGRERGIHPVKAAPTMYEGVKFHNFLSKMSVYKRTCKRSK